MSFDFPLVVCVATCVWTVAVNLISVPSASMAASRWLNLSLACGTFMGVVRLTGLHVRRIGARQEGWRYSAVLLMLLYVSLIVLLIHDPGSAIPRFIMSYVYTPIAASTLSLATFCLFSAAHRTFRLVSAEMTLFTIAAVLAVLWQTPFVEYGIPFVAAASKWVYDVPASAGMRAFQISVTVGGLAVSMRVALGLERWWSGRATGVGRL